eukprot:11006372-Alexandrium_andersonii.AAC.1
MTDCGLRRIGALKGLGRIADCTEGTLRCKDARLPICGLRLTRDRRATRFEALLSPPEAAEHRR